MGGRNTICASDNWLTTGSYITWKYVFSAYFGFCFYLVFKLPFKKWNTICKPKTITISLIDGFRGGQWAGISWVVLTTWARCGWPHLSSLLDHQVAGLAMMVLLRCFISITVASHSPEGYHFLLLLRL